MKPTTEFDYLEEVAAKYGTCWLAEEFDAFLVAINEEQLGELRQAYDLIDKKEDAFRISRWLDSCLATHVSYRERQFSQQIGSLLNLFSHLGRNNVSPFANRKVRYIEQPRTPNWENLPPEFDYLRAPAERYGAYGSESDMLEFLENAAEDDMEILGRTAEKIHSGGHMESINDWLNRYPMDKHQEAWLVYCLLGVMDHSGLL